MQYIVDGGAVKPCHQLGNTIIHLQRHVRGCETQMLTYNNALMAPSVFYVPTVVLWTTIQSEP